jgi:hypothetical protein
MGSIPNNQVICKCPDLLDLSDERDKTFDFRAQKLTAAKLVKLMIEAQLRHGNKLIAI